MSVKTLESYQEFTADGSTTYFTFNFNYVDSSEIVVGMRTGDNQYTVVDPVNYVLTKSASTDGGKIRFVTTKPCENPDDPTCGDYIDNPPPAGTIVRIERKTVQSSTADWQVGLDMTALVALFDKVFRITQENSGRIDNAIKTFPTQQGILLHELLEKHNNKILYWDNDKKTITPADVEHQNIAQAIGGMYFRMTRMSNPERTVLQYSKDGNIWLTLTDENAINHLQSQINVHETRIDALENDKLDKQQGINNVGKVMTVGGDGKLIPRVPQGGGGIGAVAHDDTLFGAGTDEWPLGVKDKVTITIVDWE